MYDAKGEMKIVKKSLSLKKSSEFQRILKKGKWIRGEYISVYILPNTKNTNYLGIAVRKKGINSVKRNRIKRLIRESYKNTENSVVLGYNIVVVWKSKNKFENATYDNISNDISKCLQKANMIK